jgi:4-diphosphocytidyl-2-C-methyl-D-erythritol kinase
MKCRAYAKVNLALNVIRRRDDGYHDLESIMVPIQLHDLIEIHPFHTTVFECVPPFRIATEKNTLLRMIEVCREQFHFTEQFRVRLYKHIPSQAGLGGGSSDAAAVLNYLDRFYRWNLSDQAKIELAVKVGADVPFCLFEKPALVEGIGEKLSFFETKLDYWMVLVQARKGVSTKKAFEGLNVETMMHPDVSMLQSALENDDYTQLCLAMGNSLEARAIDLVPEIQELKQKLMELGCDVSMMTGSGSVVMGFSQNEEVIDQCIRYFRKKVRFVRKTKILS